MKVETKATLAVLISVLALGAVAVGLYTQLAQSPSQPPLAASGSTHSFFEDFQNGLQSAVTIHSGQTTTLSASAATTTLTASQLCGGTTFVWNLTTNNATATLPTVASLVSACLPKAGNSLTVRFRSSAATTTFKVVGGTGMTIYHVMEFATTTAQGTTITSSTPSVYVINLTLASGTDSTADVLQQKYLTP